MHEDPQCGNATGNSHYCFILFIYSLSEHCKLCEFPENIHTLPTKKENKNLNWNFQSGDRFKPKNPPWRGVWIFSRWNITISPLISWATRFFKPLFVSLQGSTNLYFPWRLEILGFPCIAHRTVVDYFLTSYYLRAWHCIDKCKEQLNFDQTIVTGI